MSETPLKNALKDVAEARDNARRDAQDAITKLLGVLRDQLGGEQLQGLPNIGHSSLPYRALPVRKVTRTNMSLRDDQKAALVLDPSGNLRMAQMVTVSDGPAIQDSPIDPDILLAEDLQLVAECVAEAIEKHLQACGRKWRRYNEVSMLAERLNRALDG